MRFSSSSVAGAVAAFFTTVSGQLGPAPITDPRFHDWKPPGRGDVRSPCPGLNTLANHGFIAHSGKNITIPMLIDGGAAGMNIGQEFMGIIGVIALQSAADPTQLMFNLDDLDTHNFPIEHDNSLTRQDKYFGQWFNFKPSIYKQYISHYKGLTSTTTQSAAIARFSRVQDSAQRNPDWTYGPHYFAFSATETAIFIQVLSDPVTNSAKLSYVKEFFTKQRLPVDLGWIPSPLPVDFATMGAYVGELYAANPDTFIDSEYATEYAIADAFVTAAGGAAAIQNNTQGLSDAWCIPGLLNC